MVIAPANKGNEPELPIRAVWPMQKCANMSRGWQGRKANADAQSQHHVCPGSVVNEPKSGLRNLVEITRLA